MAPVCFLDGGHPRGGEQFERYPRVGSETELRKKAANRLRPGRRIERVRNFA